MVRIMVRVTVRVRVRVKNWVRSTSLQLCARAKELPCSVRRYFLQCTTSSGCGWRCDFSSIPGGKYCRQHDAYDKSFESKSQKGSEGAPAAEVRIVFFVCGWFSDGKPAIAYLFII